MFFIRFIAVFGLSLGCVQAQDTAPQVGLAPDGFWDHWGDGSAEVNGYTLTQPRYGQTRTGEAVLVFVTETFTAKQRVKSDGGHPDEYPVIKLNEIRDFQTGVYDYNTMTSSFVRLDGVLALGTPTKVSFSMQEWCGHVWEQWTVDAQRWHRIGHSYFDGEGDVDISTPLPSNVVFEDTLPIFVRGLAGKWIDRGASKSIQLIPTALRSRIRHQEPKPLSATLHRLPQTQTRTTPAGTFDVSVWTVTTGGQSIAEYAVEVAAPYRIIQWTSSDGGTGTLTGSTRLRYWQNAKQGDETLRAALGLPPR